MKGYDLELFIRKKKRGCTMLFDEKIYMGYAIKSLVFSLPGDDYESNVIRMDLEIESERYGVYQMTRYYQCCCLQKNTVEIKQIE